MPESGAFGTRNGPSASEQDSDFDLDDSGELMRC
jgi:hypothetical protein